MRIYIIRVGHDLRRHSPPAIPTLRNIATAKMLPGWSNIPNVQNKSRNGRWSILTHGTLQNTLPRQFTDMASNARLGLANACHYPNPPPTNYTEELYHQAKTSFRFRSYRNSRHMRRCAYKSMPPTNTHTTMFSFRRLRNCDILF